MLKLKSLLKSNLFFLLLVTALFALSPQEAWSAEGVFETVRQKAAASLKDVKLVVYILGGFGLIGFSFMAIFNKISWKWFANIAISLFLLSVMGLFIDDFTGTDEHAALLDYGDYLNVGNEYENPGTSDNIPKTEVPPGDPDPTKKDEKQTQDCDNPASDDYWTEACIETRNFNGAMAECTLNGGNWDSTTGTCSTGGE